MTDQQWEILKKIINGEKMEPLPIGFIADSPWLPGWYGIKILDYFSNDELWLKANLKAIQEFPDIMFLPGFWSEFGMCTEPSAFGARCRFPQNEFPHAHPVIKSPDEINALVVPEPEADGLLPFVLNRLKLAQPHIENAGHKIRFAVARGPLNIASFLMGTTEFLMAMLTSPELVETLMEKITAFLKNWLKLQRDTFSTIDGIFLLDDIIGFIGEQEFRQFGLPYFKELFDADVSVKFLHNDAQCRVSVPFLPEIGVNLFNMGFDVSLNDIKIWTNNQVTLLGNIPPRDVLANGKPEDVVKSVTELLDSLEDKSRVILSCGGGLPPGVSTENLRAFIETVKKYSHK
ncbi:MAG TPA: uroporphyrinogen decarboxylase family protein [Candidatus Marinimicrobia bacterium]|nr:uroporphyrinogen decarboxylase family protein [Candidatus Neomarinimicrobiota bacterium]HRS52097.1 uroporphyrinogen decarboxylase family protein [Candidatus Neomarinimicrobiota bacterium]HRU92848.1 uroporphyrinogen decarboxylase family protein [Candidatus Neomarinimicrobiota bacterium]